MPISVPNLGPTISQPYRLAVIGECPTYEDTQTGRPFTGTPGKIITSLLQGAGALAGACYFGNIRQQEHNYFANKGKKFLPTSVTDVVRTNGLALLKRDFSSWRPNCVLLLGTEPLEMAGINHSVATYRGSIFRCKDTASPFFGIKCVATYTPSFVIRNWDVHPLMRFDVARAVNEARSPELDEIERRYDVELSSEQIILKLNAIPDGTLTSIDIEGGVETGITCIAVSTDPSYAFIINNLDFPDSELTRIMRALARVLGSPAIPKVLQNSLYDNFVLSWLWKMPIRNVRHDTMLSGWEIYPELPKGLGTQVSIWTRHPYYKHERKIDDKLTHYRYCCTDAALTLEIAQQHGRYMSNKSQSMRKHYDFNMSLLPAFHYMELRGIRYNRELAAEKLSDTALQMSHLQQLIDTAAGIPVNPNCNNGVNSLANVLYKRMGFEPQYKTEHGRKTTSTTADVEALLTLLKRTDNPIIYHLLQWRALEGVRKQLEITTDADGRMRCGYNVVGTETGRMTCYESPSGNGTNLQTITKKLRCLYQADPGMIMFQCDLSGADGWTVAARCKSLGDSTMWDDYIYGLKPARIIASMYEASKTGGSISRLSRDELALFIKQIEIPSWLYEACKAVQHGSNYNMKKNTMSSNLLKQSWKKSHNPIYVSPRDCEALQNIYLNHRYTGIARWHDWVNKELISKGFLDCASGHVRHFFGRRNDQTTIQAALAHEPQANTTYVTNIALANLWNDDRNRRSDGTLIIEPLHQVHDALIGQFPASQLKECTGRIREYFNNTITIADIDLVIPFEGGYGEDWGTLEGVI